VAECHNAAETIDAGVEIDDEVDFLWRRSMILAICFRPANSQNGQLRCACRLASIRGITKTNGFLAIDSDAFPSDSAADVPESAARFMAICQVPISAGAFVGGKATVAAWKRETELRCDCHAGQNINPDLERFMARRAPIPSDRARGQPRNFSFARQRGGNPDRKCGRGSEVGFETGDQHELDIGAEKRLLPGILRHQPLGLDLLKDWRLLQLESDVHRDRHQQEGNEEWYPPRPGFEILGAEILARRDDHDERNDDAEGWRGLQPPGVEAATPVRDAATDMYQCA